MSRPTAYFGAALCCAVLRPGCCLSCACLADSRPWCCCFSVDHDATGQLTPACVTPHLRCGRRWAEGLFFFFSAVMPHTLWQYTVDHTHFILPTKAFEQPRGRCNGHQVGLCKFEPGPRRSARCRFDKPQRDDRNGHQPHQQHPQLNPLGPGTTVGAGFGAGFGGGGGCCRCCRCG